MLKDLSFVEAPGYPWEVILALQECPKCGVEAPKLFIPK